MRVNRRAKLTQTSIPASAIKYTHPFNGVTDTFTTKAIPLHFQGDYNGDYSIAIEQDYLRQGWVVELEDKLTGSRVNLRQGTDSVAHVGANQQNRFVLHFRRKTAMWQLEEPPDR
ncbi:MAG: hypothetical protein U5L96_15450 [Owenweeksia sp.]|nr:hypothetical protein [Owenweeksia sp.]